MAEEKEEIELLRRIADNTRAISWFIGGMIILLLIAWAVVGCRSS